MLNETFSPNSATIMRRIISAIQQQQIELLQDLVLEYHQCIFSAAITEINIGRFNKLLVQAVRDDADDIVLALVALGADPNQFITFVLEVRDQRAFFMLDDMPAMRYTSTAPHAKARTVDCYFLDLLVILGKHHLMQLIGLNNFDLSIYQVNNSRAKNILNSKVNREGYIPNTKPCYKTCCNSGDARRQFESEVMQRRMWCSIFCSFLARNNDVAALQQLRDGYVGESVNGSYDTLNIVQLYLHALENRGGSRFWHDMQYYMDLYLNLSLATDAANFCLAPRLDSSVINMMPKDDQVGQKAAAVISSYYWNRDLLSGFCTKMLPVAIFTFIFAVQDLVNYSNSSQESTVEDYAVIVMNSLSLAFLTVETAKLLTALTGKVVSAGRLQCQIRAPQLTAFSLYTHGSLAEIINPAPQQPAPAAIRPASPGQMV